MAGAYYSENDADKAAWLRELIARKLIAPGVVDERSIVDVSPGDLVGFTQCHFFAGIGVWSYALRQSGWADDSPVWTGSCPCQSFSASGKREGFDDPRHLWPAWFRLIRERHPDVCFGEQVASGDGLAWFDVVSSDLEGAGYAIGASDLCAAGVGAPHIRQRLYFVAESDEGRREGFGAPRLHERWQGTGGDESAKGCADRPLRDDADGCGSTGDLDDAECHGRREKRLGRHSRHDREFTAAAERDGGVADTDGERVPHAGAGFPQGEPEPRERGDVGDTASRGRGIGGNAALEGSGGHTDRAVLAGFWSDAEWIPCTDGKARPVEPGVEQMVDGSAESLGRLRDENVRAAEAEIDEAARRHQTDPREAVRDLWCALSAEAIRGRAIGGLRGVHEPPILLAFLRQLSEQGWSFAESISRASKETTEALLRGVRNDMAPSRPSRERGLDGQPTGERPDLMRVLSSILARHAQTAWGEAFDTNAAAVFPLAVGARNRVMRLRGYGDGLVAPVAIAFIQAFLEVRAER